MSRSHLYITGTLAFTPRKITLVSGDMSYFVKPFSVSTGYVHGDRVRAKIVKRGDSARMSEVSIISIVGRSREALLARIVIKKGKRYLKVIGEQGNLETPYPIKGREYEENTILSIQFGANETVHIISVFGKEDDIDLDEKLILWLSRARTEFSTSVLQEGEDIRKNTKQIDTTHRVNFKDWYTFTIDGSDAKDLDDAISIRRKGNNGYELAVHIADVAEYVTEGSELDREAIKRATSIYTPGKVIPMLPEVLSNDLCSLHPGSPKLVLSCIMTVDSRGNVEKSEIVEGIIESKHRGVYDDIYQIMKGEKNPGIDQELSDSIVIATELFHILEKRRRKEGKITFESTEVYFNFDNQSNKETKTPTHIKKRDRNDAHKLIEEFMVLANEEVAKWCHKHGLPFLSRVHGLPGNEQTEIIQGILSLEKEGTKKTFGKIEIENLEPTHIREFLEKINNPIDLYRYSRLLLPKMAKATYSDTPYRHFGLALEYYSHFTSPIRRYPDLQIHRIIKEKIRGKLGDERIAHYKTILKRVGRNCSERERSAEDIERSMNSLYICRYMSDKIGKTYNGQISGLAEFALFVELENGIETTLYLPRGKYHINNILGILSTLSGKKLGSIGESVQVRIESINMTERRVIVERV